MQNRSCCIDKFQSPATLCPAIFQLAPPLKKELRTLQLLTDLMEKECPENQAVLEQSINQLIADLKNKVQELPIPGRPGQGRGITILN